MPRRTVVLKKRELKPDQQFGSQLVAKFINHMMYGGKKGTAERIFYKALEIVEAKTQEPGFKVFKQAIENCKPAVEVRSRRVGGANYQVPVEVRQDRRQALAFRWILSYSRDRKGKPMCEKLAEELIDAFKLQGGAYKKKEDTHKMAEANKAFAHFRW